MASVIGKLTALKVEKAREPGMYGDGGGLYLRVTSDGTKNWVYRYMLAGRPRWMGLGPFHVIGLAEARARATERRRQRHDGIDPIEARRVEKRQAGLGSAATVDFQTCAERYIAAHKAGWRNAKHAAQWTSTLATYAYPQIGKLAIQSIDTTLIMKVVEPIWTTTPETASRLRQRIEAILDWARVRGYRQGENPARWRGHLQMLLPARAKVHRVQHHAALPHSDIADFVAALRQQDGVAARALEFAILTAARTGETTGATWNEIDLPNASWTVPPERMKAGKEHRVPLNKRAVEIVVSMKNLIGEAMPQAYLFPGARHGRPLSNMAFLMTLRRMGRADLTAHGFRSTFRDWCADRTNFPGEVAEAALAHAVGNRVEAAYRRGDLFEKRRRLMEQWGEFCASKDPSRRIDVSPSQIVSAR